MFLSFLHHSWAEVRISRLVCGTSKACFVWNIFEFIHSLCSPFLSRWPTLTHSSSICWSSDTLWLYMWFIPLNDKKVPLVNGIEYSSNCIFSGDVFAVVSNSNNDQALLWNRQGQNNKLAPWVQSLLYTLRILGPSNGRVWTCIAEVRVLKIAVFEASGFLGYVYSDWLQCGNTTPKQYSKWWQYTEINLLIDNCHIYSSSTGRTNELIQRKKSCSTKPRVHNHYQHILLMAFSPVPFEIYQSLYCHLAIIPISFQPNLFEMPGWCHPK